jgi:hypothetical protein
MFWKDLPEHNPTKLDSVPNSIPTANDDFPKINYTQCHFNYYCKVILPKMVKLVSQARYITELPLEIDITQFQNTKLKFCIFEQKGARSTHLIPPAFYRGQTFKHAIFLDSTH